MNVELSTRDVARLAGVSYRQIDYWARTGLLKPSGREARGKGSRRRYTFQDAVAIRTVSHLRALGCPLQKIRKAVRFLKTHFPTDSNAGPLARLTLLTDGADVYLLHDETAAMDIITRQLVWPVPLGQLILDTRSQIDALPLEREVAVKLEGRSYRLVVTRDPQAGGYVVQCRELPGAISQGESFEEAIDNGRDAVRTVLQFLSRRQSLNRGQSRGKAG